MRRSDEGGAVTRQRPVALVIAAPLVAAVGFMAAVSLSGATGIGPFKPDPPRNPSEALILSDAATAVRMFRTGADPTAVYDVRLTLLSRGMDEHIRPLVAAAYARDDVVVGVALREGATLPPEEARVTACWLASRGRENVSRMLMPPEWMPGACQTGGEARDK